MPSPEYTHSEKEAAGRLLADIELANGVATDIGCSWFLPCYALTIDLQCALTRANARIERLTDLVRHQRGELFETGLISAEEYAELVADSHNGSRVARLEGYDLAVAALEAKNGR